MKITSVGPYRIERDVFVSPGGVCPIWLRHELESFANRFKVLEAKSAQDNLIVTEAQMQTLEQAKMQMHMNTCVSHSCQSGFSVRSGCTKLFI